MKKVFASIIIMIYFTVSTGFTVNVHYCMDKLLSFEVGNAQSDLCSNCGMPVEKNSSCCRDEVKVVKLQQEVFPSAAFTYAVNLALPISSVNSYYLQLPFQNAAPAAQPHIHPPPLISAPQLYLSNCVFLI